METAGTLKNWDYDRPEHRAKRERVEMRSEPGLDLAQGHRGTRTT